MPGTPSARRERSRRVLLEAARRRPITRQDLSVETGLSRSAVAAGVADLIAAGLLVERPGADGVSSGRGRHAPLLEIARPPGYVIGIDFGHTHTRVALADTSGAVVDERLQTVDVDGQSERALDATVRLVEQLLGKHHVARHDVLSVGAGIPGPIDRYRHVVDSPTILGSWIELNPVDELQRRLGRPVHVANDADMGAIGESRYGIARQYRDFLYIKASHGIGASLVINGECYVGATGIAGEIGHTQLPGATARCRCGNQGCLEAVISVAEVRRQLDHTHLRTPARGPEPALSAVAQDPVGARILLDAGRTVGRVVADGCNWLNPEAIVLGGELGASGQPFADGFRESLDRYAQPATALAVTVHIAALGNRPEVMGAVAVAIDHASVP